MARAAVRPLGTATATCVCRKRPLTIREPGSWATIGCRVSRERAKASASPARIRAMASASMGTATGCAAGTPR